MSNVYFIIYLSKMYTLWDIRTFNNKLLGEIVCRKLTNLYCIRDGIHMLTGTMRFNLGNCDYSKNILAVE